MSAPFKVAIIGAGSVGFTKTLISDILKVPEFTACEFALTDINQHNLDMVRQIIETIVSSPRTTSPMRNWAVCRAVEFWSPTSCATRWCRR